MEAKKFGFGRSMPPAFKFDPTDSEIVAYYLVPRALNLPNPYASAIVDEDPCSAPPWEFLQRHSGVDHAFFFGPPADPSHNAGRKNRTVKGGVWQGQKGIEKTVTLLRPGGGEVNIRYKRYHLSFRLTKGRPTGYVMHEYEILSPPLPGIVLTRIKVTEKLKKQLVAAEQQVPNPEQLVLSYEYDAAQLMSNGQGSGGAQDGAPYGSGMVENAGYNCPPLQYELPVVEHDDDDCCVSISDQPGVSYNNHDAPMNGEGFTTAQADAYGGGMVDNAGDGACYEVVSGHYAPCGNSDNGSVVGTETSAQSPTSLHSDGELDFFDMLMSEDGLVGLMRERKDAGDPANEPH